MKEMHELPVHDPTIHNGTLRPDGRMVHDTYLFRVKTPAESKGPFDFYTLQSDDPRRGGVPAAFGDRMPGAETGLMRP